VDPARLVDHDNSLVPVRDHQSRRLDRGAPGRGTISLTNCFIDALTNISCFNASPHLLRPFARPQLSYGPRPIVKGGSPKSRGRFGLTILLELSNDSAIVPPTGQRLARSQFGQPTDLLTFCVIEAEIRTTAIGMNNGVDSMAMAPPLLNVLHLCEGLQRQVMRRLELLPKGVPCVFIPGKYRIGVDVVQGTIGPAMQAKSDQLVDVILKCRSDQGRCRPHDHLLILDMEQVAGEIRPTVATGGPRDHASLPMSSTS
jgi:hypothetical protein